MGSSVATHQGAMMTCLFWVAHSEASETTQLQVAQGLKSNSSTSLQGWHLLMKRMGISRDRFAGT